MQRAIELSKKAVEHGNEPFGAVLVKDNKIVYENENQIYTRYVNGIKHTDYFKKEDFQSKNIIILEIPVGYADNNYYLDLKNVGTGNGYYVTNGSSKKIKWEKVNRKSQTTYKYEDGTELVVNDGNTYIMFRSSDQTLNIS